MVVVSGDAGAHGWHRWSDWRARRRSVSTAARVPGTASAAATSLSIAGDEVAARVSGRLSVSGDKVMRYRS